MAAKVVSILNLKGGVGKSTLAMMLAEYMAFVHRKRVLLIDLDSQANLTAAMIRPMHIINELVPKGFTIHRFFTDFLKEQRNPLTDYRCPNPDWVSNIVREGFPFCLDMVASCPELADLDDDMLRMWENKESCPKHIRFAIRDALSPALGEYAAVIIDCPPGLSLSTTAAIVASDYYVCPLIPEPFSIIGVELTQNRVARVKQQCPQARIEYAGTIINKFMRRTPHLMKTTRLYGESFKGYDPYDTKKFRPFQFWVPDSEDLRKLGRFETEIDTPYWKFGPKPGYFDTPYRKWGGWNRAEGTNPAGYPLDRSDSEGTKYQVSIRLGVLTQEFMERVGIT